MAMAIDQSTPESELDAFLGPAQPGPSAPPQRLGIVVGGSLSAGLDVRLDQNTVIEGLAVGRYVVIHGQTGRRFFSMVTDVELDALNPLIEKAPPDTSDPFLARVYQGTAVFGRIHVAPLLTLDPGAREPKPVKTVPAHFTPVYPASEEEVNLIFGAEREAGHFYVGEPLEMEGTHIALDLNRLVERSAGVFGKTGTGKSFLTRMLLAGIIQQGVAVNLVFDMHGEYGWKSQDESRREVKGLRQLFQSQVAVFTLDEESSRRRDSKVDGVVRIGYEQIEPDDIATVAKLLDLSDIRWVRSISCGGGSGAPGSPACSMSRIR